MKILSIETSCDETAISLVECSGDLNSPKFVVLGNALISQINLHREYGGVFPTLAKREHATNLPIILKKVLEDSHEYTKSETSYPEEKWSEIKEILSKEIGLYETTKILLNIVQKPDVDYIAVTVGPGLAPALWVGISFARALSLLWNIPLIPVNHMEGHIASVLINNNSEKIIFPALALLISGGHTELVNIKNWGEYQIVGETVDDAVGEAFDKSARMLGLPYPGGPEISKLALYAEENNVPRVAKLPRPMLHSQSLNFSFSGLKTAVLYYIRDNFGGDSSTMTQEEKADLAREFKEAVIEVLLQKTKRALSDYSSETLIIAGGVIADEKIRSVFLKLSEDFNGLVIKIPQSNMSTDNSVMIASAAYLNILRKPDAVFAPNDFTAQGNMRLK